MRTQLLLIAIVSVACSVTVETEGPTISPVDIPAQGNSSLPYLVVGADGELYFSWVEKTDSSNVELKYSKREGNFWSSPEVIASGSDWFVNWADYPMIAANENGDLIANYLAKSSSGTYSYDVNLVIKPKDGLWSNPIIPHSDGTPTEHGFVTMLPLENNNFQVAWLDGRNTGGSHGSYAGSMTIRTAELSNTGEVSSEFELDSRVCDCCQTTGVIASNGPVFFYRDRSELEIRDISSTRLLQAGWSPPSAIANDNWTVNGCPVNGPRADNKGDTIAVAWYSGANGQPKVQVAFSMDGGDSYEQPITIDSDNPLGRVDISFYQGSNVLVSWLATTDTGAAIKVAIVSPEGKSSKPFLISNTSEARSSGFPQLVTHNDQVYIAWTKPGESSSTIEMVSFSFGIK